MRTNLLVLALLLSAGVLLAEERPMSYIYKRGDESYTRINGAIDRIRDVAKKYGNEFVWVRLSGRHYVIRDAATLAEVRNAFAAVEAMEPSLRAVEERMKPFEREMEKIEERIDSLSDRLDDERLSESARDTIEDRLHVTEREMQAVESKMHVVEREMERIENESEKREAVAEDRFEEIVKRAIARGVADRVQ